MVDESDITRRAREQLVNEIERRESLDPRVACALRMVQRHLFVPKTLLDRAYEDGPLPIGHGQTISQRGLFKNDWIACKNIDNGHSERQGSVLFRAEP